MNDLFPVLPPERGPGAKLKAVLAVFPDVTEYDDLEAVQRNQKTKFVEQGLMLGQFYPGCTVAGLHNPEFPALDSPLPLLAMRQMAPTDFAFLNARHEWIGLSTSGSSPLASPGPSPPRCPTDSSGHPTLRTNSAPIGDDASQPAICAAASSHATEELTSMLAIHLIGFGAPGVVSGKYDRASPPPVHSPGGGPCGR